MAPPIPAADTWRSTFYTLPFCVLQRVSQQEADPNIHTLCDSFAAGIAKVLVDGK